MSETTVVNPETTAEVVKVARVAKAKVELEGTKLVFTFANGNVSTVDASALPASITERAIMHGIEQKLRDSYAGAKSADEAQGLFSKVMDNLVAGEWNGGRASGEPAEDSLDMLAQAIVNAYASQGVTKDLAAIRAYVESLAKTDRTKLRAKSSVMVELAKLRAAKKSDFGIGLDDIG